MKKRHTMRINDGVHWNIYEILPYQRNFNFINGERSLGKTYSTQMYLLDRAIRKGQEFVYIVRTMDEQKGGVMREAFAKVTSREFPAYEFQFKGEFLSYRMAGEEYLDDPDNEWVRIGYCLALSAALRIKKKSFPLVKHIMFDEYMLEDSQTSSYVKGWKEPDMLLSIYHTIDREEDRVICFLLGNNTRFHNPYHLHRAFRVQPVPKGEIWTSENVLYQNAKATDRLKNYKSGNKFLNMIDDTNYGAYAKDGNYIYDNYQFIKKMTGNVHCVCVLHYNGFQFGVWRAHDCFYVSDKYDPSTYEKYALTNADHTENTMLTGFRYGTFLTFFIDMFKRGNVKFTSMDVKANIEDAIIKLC